MFGKENIIVDKSKSFAIRIIKLYQYLTETKKEYVMSKQILVAITKNQGKTIS